jgi:hypothetical protein
MERDMMIVCGAYMIECINTESFIFFCARSITLACHPGEFVALVETIVVW